MGIVSPVPGQITIFSSIVTHRKQWFVCTVPWCSSCLEGSHQQGFNNKSGRSVHKLCLVSRVLKLQGGTAGLGLIISNVGSSTAISSHSRVPDYDRARCRPGSTQTRSLYPSGIHTMPSPVSIGGYTTTPSHTLHIPHRGPHLYSKISHAGMTRPTVLKRPFFNHVVIIGNSTCYL